MISSKQFSSASDIISYLSKDNYYTNEEGFEKSQWMGKSAEELGLSGGVHKEEFEALLNGNVEGQKPLGRWEEGVRVHRAAMDLTFSPPKSISVMAVGDDRIRALVKESGMEGMSYLQREGAQARVTVDGITSFEKTGNLLFAAFQHDTSRKSNNGLIDPNEHVHFVMLNMTKCADGKWHSLSNEAVLNLRTTADAVALNHLARGLEKLGYELEYTENRFEIKGFTREAIEHFSQRRGDMTGFLAEKGIDIENATQKERQNANSATRNNKEAVDREKLIPEIKERALAFGIDIDQRVAQAKERAPNVNLGDSTELARTSLKYAIDHLTEREQVIERKDILKEALHRAMGGVDISTMDKIYESLVKDGYLIPATHGIDKDKGEMVTTAKALDAERKLVFALARAKGAVAATAGEAAFQKGVAAFTEKSGRTLNQGQMDAARLLVTTTDRIVGVQGFAGVGKTTMLSAAKGVVDAVGGKMLGLAVTVPAANQLRAETGMETMTVAKFLLTAGKMDLKGCLVTVDEASMLGMEDGNSLIRIAEAKGAKISFLGDIEQFDGVSAGPFFEVGQAVGMRIEAVTEILRQKGSPLLESAIADIIADEQGAALEKLKPIQVEVPEGEDIGVCLAAPIANMYADKTAAERANMVVVTSTNKDREAINDAVRAKLKANGQLAKEGLTTDVLVNKSWTKTQIKFAKNYQKTKKHPLDTMVRFGGNYKSLGVKDGEYGRVVSADGKTGIVKLDMGNGKVVDWEPQQMKNVEVYSVEKREFSVGDKVRFARGINDSVFNGSTGTVESIDGATINVRLNSGKVVPVDTTSAAYKHIEHGYASTIHSVQGLTKEEVIFAINSSSKLSMSDKAFYVAVTRAQFAVAVFTDDLKAIVELVSREQRKTSALAATGRTAAAKGWLAQQPEFSLADSQQVKNGQENIIAPVEGYSLAVAAVKEAIEAIAEPGTTITHNELVQEALKHGEGLADENAISHAISLLVRDGDLIMAPDMEGYRAKVLEGLVVAEIEPLSHEDCIKQAVEQLSLEDPLFDKGDVLNVAAEIGFDRVETAQLEAAFESLLEKQEIVLMQDGTYAVTVDDRSPQHDEIQRNSAIENRPEFSAAVEAVKFTIEKLSETNASFNHYSVLGAALRYAGAQTDENAVSHAITKAVRDGVLVKAPEAFGTRGPAGFNIDQKTLKTVSQVFDQDALKAIVAAVSKLERLHVDYDRADVMREALQQGGKNVTTATLEKTFDEAVEGKDRWLNQREVASRVYTTADALQSEMRMVTEIARGKGAISVLSSDDVINKAAAEVEIRSGRALDDNQMDAIKLATKTTDRFSAINGFAGDQLNDVVAAIAMTAQKEGANVTVISAISSDRESIAESLKQSLFEKLTGTNEIQVLNLKSYEQRAEHMEKKRDLAEMRIHAREVSGAPIIQFRHAGNRALGGMYTTAKDGTILAAKLSPFGGYRKAHALEYGIYKSAQLATTVLKSIMPTIREINVRRRDAKLLNYSRDVIIVTDAHLLSQREITKLKIDVARMGKQLVLAGNKDAANSVGAGRPFDTAIKHGIAVIHHDKSTKMDKVVLEAAGALKEKRVGKALGILNEGGKIHSFAGDSGSALEKIASLYTAKKQGTGTDVDIVTHLKAERDVVNVYMHDHLKNNGILSGKSHEVPVLSNKSLNYGMDARSFNKDDVVKFSNADVNLGIKKGEYATVREIDTHEVKGKLVPSGYVVLQTESGKSVSWLPEKSQAVEVYSQRKIDVSVGERLRFGRQNTVEKQTAIGKVLGLGGSEKNAVVVSLNSKVIKSGGTKKTIQTATLRMEDGSIKQHNAEKIAKLNGGKQLIVGEVVKIKEVGTSYLTKSQKIITKSGQHGIVEKLTQSGSAITASVRLDTGELRDLDLSKKQNTHLDYGYCHNFQSADKVRGEAILYYPSADSKQGFREFTSVAENFKDVTVVNANANIDKVLARDTQKLTATEAIRPEISEHNTFGLKPEPKVEQQGNQAKPQQAEQQGTEPKVGQQADQAKPQQAEQQGTEPKVEQQADQAKPQQGAEPKVEQQADQAKPQQAEQQGTEPKVGQQADQAKPQQAEQQGTEPKVEQLADQQGTEPKVGQQADQAKPQQADAPKAEQQADQAKPQQAEQQGTEPKVGQQADQAKPQQAEQQGTEPKAEQQADQAKPQQADAPKAEQQADQAKPQQADIGIKDFSKEVEKVKAARQAGQPASNTPGRSEQKPKVEQKLVEKSVVADKTMEKGQEKEQSQARGRGRR